jgi:hypothetical protein
LRFIRECTAPPSTPVERPPRRLDPALKAAMRAALVAIMDDDIAKRKVTYRSTWNRNRDR